MDGSPKREEEVDAFLRGDPAQLALLEGAVRAIVRSFRFGDADIERDLIQETLSRTLAGLSDHRFLGLASLRTYACNIARYTCLEHIRRRRNEVTFDPDLHPTQDRWGAPEASYLSTEEHRRNLEAFAALPEQCRELLQMICLEGVSYREAAARLGISEATLKSRIHRCRLTCRQAAKSPRRLGRLLFRRTSP
jgi:RNA polymerase sigma-70 factor (ECF subfamily)